MDINSKNYEVALSFAGEDRSYVELVARDLRGRGVSVFYDEYERIQLWGTDQNEHFSAIYGGRASKVVLFISQHYLNKMWPRQERRAALSKAMDQDGYVLPVRFDATELPGIPRTTGYLDLQLLSPAELSVSICEKIERLPGRRSDAAAC